MVSDVGRVIYSDLLDNLFLASAHASEKRSLQVMLVAEILEISDGQSNELKKNVGRLQGDLDDGGH